MARRPAGADAAIRARRHENAGAVYAAVSAHLLRKAQDDGLAELDGTQAGRLWFVALPERYRTKDHPVLGPVNVDEVIGLRAYYQRNALDWARHWLGLRGFLEVMDYHEFCRQQERGKFPEGCPRASVVPAARFYSHPSGGEIIVWVTGDPFRSVYRGIDIFGRDLDAYTDDTHTRRKQVNVTPEKLEAGHGAWVEVFYDHTGVQLTREQVAEICRGAGVL